jgi:hypothetical protein
MAVANAYLSFAGSQLADVWVMLGDNAYSIGSARPRFLDDLVSKDPRRVLRADD